MKKKQVAANWYTDRDLGRLRSLSTHALYEKLDERLLPPPPARLTHAHFCNFRQALLDDPTQDDTHKAQFPGLSTKIRGYMELPATKQLLRSQFNLYPTLKSMMKGHHHIRRNAGFTGLPGEEPDAVTGAIRDDCAPCLSYFYKIGAIVSGTVNYNENGWALVAGVIKSRAFSTLEPLIAHSGLDPGPFQPSQVLRKGEKATSILRLFAAEAPEKQYFHSMMTWCDQFIVLDEPRVAGELDSSAQYNLCKMGCVKIADWALEMKLNLGLALRTKDGKCAWHAAVYKGHPG